MFPLTLLVWLPLCSMVLAAISSSKYDVASGCGITYGNVLETLNPSRSVTHCCFQCSSNDNCLSVKHDPETNVCQLNSERYTSLPTNCTVRFEYANLIKRLGGKGINEKCTLSTECSVSYSQCYVHTCQCVIGYSYMNATESCVEECDEYGSSFTLYRGYAIVGHDEKYLTWVYSGEECERACANETTFVCRSVEYQTEEYYCILLNTTALTNQGNVEKMAFMEYYHRDCQ